jgi:hypothetical protein
MLKVDAIKKLFLAKPMPKMGYAHNANKALKLLEVFAVR